MQPTDLPHLVRRIIKNIPLKAPPPYKPAIGGSQINEVSGAKHPNTEITVRSAEIVAGMLSPLHFGSLHLFDKRYRRSPLPLKAKS